MHRSIFIFLGPLLLLVAGCQQPATTTKPKPAEGTLPAPVAAAQPSDLSTAPEDGPTLGTDPIQYQGYTLSKQLNTVELDGRPTEFSYAVLKHGGKTIAVFDGLRHPYGNATEFALVSLLGSDQKQFLIEQSIHRGSREWIVSIEPSLKVIFDSEKFGLGSGITPIDVDRDCVYELSGSIVFYGFANLAMSESPQVKILLQYGKSARRYLPANQRLEDYALRGIDEEIRSLPSPSEYGYRTKVLNVVLRYIFAGKEREGWNFFDTNYQLPDMAAIKAELKRKLSQGPTYKYLRSDRTS